VSNATHYVSGHLDLTEEESATHYEPLLRAAMDRGEAFVVGDARGADEMAQRLLIGYTDVTVFHMLETPRNNLGFRVCGGFTSDTARDAAMTEASTEDIAWIRPGREKSDTAKNIQRRLQKLLEAW
jgi:hypothetical protein